MNYLSEIARQIRQEVPPKALPKEDTDLLFLIYAVLALSTGRGTRLEHVHNAWAAWMAHHNPLHESIKPFGELDLETKKEDQPFLELARIGG